MGKIEYSENHVNITSYLEKIINILFIKLILHQTRKSSRSETYAPNRDISKIFVYIN